MVIDYINLKWKKKTHDFKARLQFLFTSNTISINMPLITNRHNKITNRIINNNNRKNNNNKNSPWHFSKSAVLNSNSKGSDPGGILLTVNNP